MNIALFAVPEVLAPLRDLWRWLMPTTVVGKSVQLSASKHGNEFAINSIVNRKSLSRIEPRSSAKSPIHRPLRILRVMETDQAPSHVGRMVISGRMADVCAELDRLAAHEATLH